MSLDNHENRRTINDNQNLGEIPVLPTTPENPEALADHLTDEDRETLKPQVVGLYEERNAEHKTKTKHKVLLALMGGGAILGTAGAVFLGLNGPKAGEQNNNNLPPAPEPTAEAPVIPGESAAPTAEPTTPVEVSPTDIPTNIASPTPVETEQGAEYSVSKLKEMPLDEYKELSIAQRSVLVTDMLEYATEMNSFKFGENFMGEDTSELYSYSPLDIASKDNTAEEIAMQDLYMHQLALTQTKDMNTSGSFDPDMATKALSGAYIDIEFTHSGKETFTDGNNLLFTEWQKTFNSLSDVTTHEFPQAIETAKITDSTTIPDDNGNMLTVVSVEYTTEELPETLGSYPEGRKMAATKDFVWSDEANMWLSYKGGFSILPAGS